MNVTERAKNAMEDATAGPWLHIPGEDEEALVVSEGERSPDAITVGGITFNPGFSVAVDLRDGDARFIATSRTLVPELVAEVERLKHELWDAARRIRAFSIDCTEHGDMTPAAKRQWHKLADTIHAQAVSS